MRFVRLLLLGAFALFGVILAINGLDYWRYHRAWNIEKRLGNEGIRRLAKLCSAREQDGHHKYPDRSSIPPEFEALDALEGFNYPGSSDFKLYALATRTTLPDHTEFETQFDVWLRIETTETGQTVSVFNNDWGGQRSKIVWSTEPLSRAASNRLVTVSVMRMHGATDWIVRPDRIEVCSSSYTVGNDRSLLFTKELSPTQFEALSAAVRGIPQRARGKRYTSSTFDGLTLAIAFTPNGTRDESGIWQSNVWVDETAPLIRLLDALLPEVYATNFETYIRRSQSEFKEQGFEVSTDTRSTSWEELRAQTRNFQRPPWWCFWRRVESLRPNGLY